MHPRKQTYELVSPFLLEEIHENAITFCVVFVSYSPWHLVSTFRIAFTVFKEHWIGVLIHELGYRWEPSWCTLFFSHILMASTLLWSLTSWAYVNSKDINKCWICLIFFAMIHTFILFTNCQNYFELSLNICKHLFIF